MQNNNTFLQNETIYLRAVELSDVDTLYRWENDTTQWATANTHAPLSRTQLWNYANDYDGDIYARRNIRFMICLNETNTAIGTVDISCTTVVSAPPGMLSMNSRPSCSSPFTSNSYSQEVSMSIETSMAGKILPPARRILLKQYIIQVSKVLIRISRYS